MEKDCKRAGHVVGKPLDRSETLLEKQKQKLMQVLNDPTHPVRQSFGSRRSNRVEEFYSLKQIQTVLRRRFYPLLCQFLMKIIIVFNLVCACVMTSTEDEDDDFQKGRRRGRG